METIGRIICYGSCKAPATLWQFAKHTGINRLYYIHSGRGEYVHDGKRYPLVAGRLYFIPYTADFTPFCDASDPIVHTYIDFELIPPIITKEVISVEAIKSEKILSALKIFTLGGTESRHCDLSSLYADPLFWELCKSSIIYIVNHIISVNGIEKIKDEIVIKSLEIMHTRMSEKLTVNGIASECYMNPDSFIRRFCRVVGVTPHSYLKNIRLQTARCLRESGMSLLQVASEVGYADASSLAHALQSSRI